VVEFHYTLALFFMIKEYSTEGEFCRECMRQAYWRHTMFNLTFGWWSFSSFFMTWYFLFINLATYLGALCELALKARPRRVARPAALVGEKARRRLEPFKHNVRLRLRGGESPAALGEELARVHGVELEVARRFVNQVHTSE
jgi:hypothetical protein